MLVESEVVAGLKRYFDHLRDRRVLARAAIW